MQSNDTQQVDGIAGDKDKDRPAKTVTISVNSKPVTVPADTTGSAIKQAAGVAADWQLFRIQGDHEIAVGDGDEIKVHPNQKFIATPGLDPA